MSKYQVKAALEHFEAFTLCGISVVTSNESGADDINALWEHFFKQSVGQYVPDKVDDVIYAVYSDYEGDHTKPYRLTIGYKVHGSNQPSQESKENHPQPPSSSAHTGLHYVKCISSNYAILSAQGPQPQSLIETWTAIWESDLNRSYQTDYEIYGPRFFEDGINEVLVCIGVKSE